MIRPVKFTTKLLTAATISDAKKRSYINKFPWATMEQIERLLDIDPSPDGKFLPWLLTKEHAGEIGNDQFPLSKIKNYLTEFIRLSRNPKWMNGDRNFGSWSVEKLDQAVGVKERILRKQLPKTELERRIMNEGVPGAKLILNDGTWKVWRVTNVDYCRFLSSNTKWCTAQLAYAKSYLSRGPVWPIYRAGKPFAQAHVGSRNTEDDMASGEFVLLDRDDKKLPLNDTTFEMLEAIRPLPDYQYFERFVWNTLSTLPDDPKYLEKVKEYINDTQDNRLMVLYLQHHFWYEALEWLLEDGYAPGLEEIMSKADRSVMKQIAESDLAGELLDYVTEVGNVQLPLFIQHNKLSEFFSKPIREKLKLTGLNKASETALHEWVSGHVDEVWPHLREFEPSAKFVRLVLTPSWKVLGQPFKGPLHKLMMEQNAEYAELYAPPQSTALLGSLPPSFVEGDEVIIGPTSAYYPSLKGSRGKVVQVGNGDSTYYVSIAGDTFVALYDPDQNVVDILPIDVDTSSISRRIEHRSEIARLRGEDPDLAIGLGCRVKVKEGIYDGEIGTIVTDDFSGTPFLVQFDHHRSWIAYDLVELVEPYKGKEQEQEQPRSTHNDALRLPAVGAIVIPGPQWNAEEAGITVTRGVISEVDEGDHDLPLLARWVGLGRLWHQFRPGARQVEVVMPDGGRISNTLPPIGSRVLATDQPATVIDTWTDADGSFMRLRVIETQEEQVAPLGDPNVILLEVGDGTVAEATPEEAEERGEYDFRVGDRARRGPDWMYGDQDAGAPDGVGVVAAIYADVYYPIRVQWTPYDANVYRNRPGARDLVRVTED